MITNIIKLFRFRLFHFYDLVEYINKILFSTIIILIISLSSKGVLKLDSLLFLIFILNPMLNVGSKTYKSRVVLLRDLQISTVTYYVYSILYSMAYGLLLFGTFYMLIHFEVIKVLTEGVSSLDALIYILSLSVVSFVFFESISIFNSLEKYRGLLILSLIVLSAIFAGYLYIFSIPIRTDGSLVLDLVYYITLLTLIIINALYAFVVSKNDFKGSKSIMEVQYEINQ